MIFLVCERDRTDAYNKVRELLESNDIDYTTAAACRGYDIKANNHIIEVRDYMPPNYRTRYDYYCIGKGVAFTRLPYTRLIDSDSLICFISGKNYIMKPVGEAISNGLKDGVEKIEKMKHDLFDNARFVHPYLSSINRNLLIVDVIYNDPATIVFWIDGTKTVVKADGEPYDPEKGLAMAFCKKASGNEGNYYNIFKKWLPKSEGGDDKDE